MAVALDRKLGGKRALRPAEQGGQHLAGLIAVVVDRLLAENDEARFFGIDQRLEDFGDCERLDRRVGLDQNAAVGAHGEGRADGFGRLLRADRDGDDFSGFAGLFEADRFLDRDLVERVHRHFDVGELDTAPVGLDADFHVVVDHPLDRDEDFHEP